MSSNLASANTFFVKLVRNSVRDHNMFIIMIILSSKGAATELVKVTSPLPYQISSHLHNPNSHASKAPVKRGCKLMRADAS